MIRVCCTSHFGGGGWLYTGFYCPVTKAMKSGSLWINQYSGMPPWFVSITQKQGRMECPENSKIYPWNIPRTLAKAPVYEKIIRSWGMFQSLLYVPLLSASNLLIIHRFLRCLRVTFTAEPWQLTWNLDEPYFLDRGYAPVNLYGWLEKHHFLIGDTSTQMVAFPLSFVGFQRCEVHQSRLPHWLRGIGVLDVLGNFPWCWEDLRW